MWEPGTFNISVVTQKDLVDGHNRTDMDCVEWGANKILPPNHLNHIEDKLPEVTYLLVVSDGTIVPSSVKVLSSASTCAKCSSARCRPG